ncbi:hypothetical protein HPG69_008522 [Diceros bicornis minor]|uniref:Ig-like domain-containing protein n=1 Tax=Diceros bicornis minor TaxID=77932 RepID=A0A7J7FA04_DICBM|nr:hypothetical protein HPG69_008522 [Diceros bicornis minor]
MAMGPTSWKDRTKPSPPVLSGPTARATPEQTVSFTCESHGFSSRNITLKWLKNGNELSASQTNSEHLPCIVAVPPTLEISQHPTAGNQMNVVTCEANKFYPQHLKLTWLENGNVSRTETASTLIESKDGTFIQMNWLLVNSSAHREDVELTCQVEHDGQPVVTKQHTVEASAHQKEQDTGGTPEVYKYKVELEVSSPPLNPTIQESPLVTSEGSRVRFPGVFTPEDHSKGHVLSNMPYVVVLICWVNPGTPSVSKKRNVLAQIQFSEINRKISSDTGTGIKVGRMAFEAHPKHETPFTRLTRVLSWQQVA